MKLALVFVVVVVCECVSACAFADEFAGIEIKSPHTTLDFDSYLVIHSMYTFSVAFRLCSSLILSLLFSIYIFSVHFCHDDKNRQNRSMYVYAMFTVIET